MIKLKSLVLREENILKNEYYYHITLAPYINYIKSQGIKINKLSTISNYKEYSKGKVFLCDIKNLEYWKYKVAEHAFHSFDDEKYHDIAIFKILKSNLTDVKIDKLGTEDSRNISYYVEYDIPPEIIEFVGIEQDIY